MNAQYQDLKRSLEGAEVTIPNLYQLLPDWQPAIHPEYERGRDEVLNPWIQRWVPNETTRKKLQKADFSRFAAVLCSESPFDKFCTVAKYFAWYFVWDDVFDCGILKDETEELQSYRDASLAYFKYTLILEGEMPDLSEFSDELQKCLHCWDEVGAHIRQECSRDTCAILLRYMLDYVSSVDKVDSIFTPDGIPSLEAYWRRRELTAAVYPVIATIPFAHGFDITESDIDCAFTRLLFKHTSYLVHITNDMFSFRKEANDGQLENLIPILMLNTGLTCNQAMQLSYHISLKEVDGFLAYEKQLLGTRTDRSLIIAESFSKGCRDVFMGLIHWSYCGERYIRRSEIRDDNVVTIRLPSPTASETSWPSEYLLKMWRKITGSILRTFSSRQLT